MTTADAYREGLAYGHRIAEHAPTGYYPIEHSLRMEVSLAGSRTLKRARALGELRGYRQARHD